MNLNQQKSGIGIEKLDGKKVSLDAQIKNDDGEIKWQQLIHKCLRLFDIKTVYRACAEKPGSVPCPVHNICLLQTDRWTDRLINRRIVNWWIDKQMDR